MSLFPQRRAAFTLIEIMVVIGILTMVLAMGAPSFLQAIRKDPLRNGANEIIEGCTRARAQAILAGDAAELVIEAASGQMFVQSSQAPDATGGENRTETLPQELAAKPAFQERLDRDVAVTLLYVNLKDKMAADQARVRFYPNGTSDEFAIVLESNAGARKISLDCVTGLPNLEVIR